MEDANAECLRLKRVYCDAVGRLFNVGNQLTGTEYRQLKSAAENARRDLEIAKLDLSERQKFR
jgi:hypothetical protein